VTKAKKARLLLARQKKPAARKVEHTVKVSALRQEPSIRDLGRFVPGYLP
jgi:hypothetical protein